MAIPLIEYAISSTTTSCIHTQDWMIADSKIHSGDKQQNGALKKEEGEIERELADKKT